MDKWAVETHNLGKKFGSATALEDINLYITAGSICGLIGPNGAGKSTLIQILMGIVKPNEGEARILGRTVNDRECRVREEVAYVPDVPVMYPQFTVKQMYELGKRLYRGWDEDLCRKFSQAFSLPVNKRIRNLSRGMKVRVSLVMAMAIRPRLLILDEPTAGLDPLARRQFLQTVINEAAALGTTVFYSTHNLNDLEQSADHIAVLDQGKLLFSRPLDEIKDSTRRFQVIFREDNIPPELTALPEVADIKTTGKVHIFTVFEDADLFEEKLHDLDLVLMERVDLSLEEIFISTMKKEGYGDGLPVFD